jgi:D-alanyl-D-alanine dipeptidase
MTEITTAKDMKLLICSCYRPADADKTWIDKFETFLRARAGTRVKMLLTLMRTHLSNY